jgi:hypothetical protein
MPGFLYNLLPVSCCDIGFLTKILGLVLALKSGLNVPLLPLGPSCPLQAILLRDLVGFDSLLRIIMAIWRTFLKFETRKTAIIVSRGLSNPSRKEVQIQKLVRPNAISGLSHPTGWAALTSENISRRFFQGCRIFSEDINSRSFLINLKGFN